jgi:hypothetical protein
MPSTASPPAGSPQRRLGLRLPRSPSPQTQYTAGSFAQPIRRVFGTARVPGAREHVDMPPPGDPRPRG